MHAPDPAVAGPDSAMPIAPSLSPALTQARVPQVSAAIDRRTFFICGLAIGIAAAAGVIARILVALIAMVTNLAFYGRFSFAPTSPWGHHLGPWLLVVPVAGGLVVGLMARYGSKAIRGHGIPEAMEQVLTNESRIPPRMTFLKPLSAAIAIGTGGPFGAEGPIIATGGALGSLVGQLLETSSDERKTLLAAGAAAGMAATFGSPVSAVLLAVELLLFEFRARSLIPVALATATAAGVRMAALGPEPAFSMPQLSQPTGFALSFYIVLGAFFGVVATWVTRAVYAVEDNFEKLPIHWMWWPALGGLVVGAVGLIAPRTLGVGYDNIDAVLSGSFGLGALASLCVFKFISWSLCLGSGTSGGTLAPLFTIGGTLGALLGALTAKLVPELGVDARIAALVGMAAIFAGASRAWLASVVFAFETTLQPLGLLPLLGGCAAAYLVSSALMRHSIMTEKIARRGVNVPSEYAADFLQRFRVSEIASQSVVVLRATDLLGGVRTWFQSQESGSHHHTFPVLGHQDALIGVVTRRDITTSQLPDDTRLSALLKRAPAVAFEDNSLREAADLMVTEDIGRLPVVSRAEPTRVVGMLAQSDLLKVHSRRLDEHKERARGLGLRFALPNIRRLGSMSD